MKCSGDINGNLQAAVEQLEMANRKSPRLAP